MQEFECCGDGASAHPFAHRLAVASDDGVLCEVRVDSRELGEEQDGACETNESND